MRGIVLDTNILHQERLSSRNMFLLRRLVKASQIEIFVPDLVKREYISRRIQEAKENLKKSHDLLTLVIKKSPHDSGFRELIYNTQESIKSAESQIEDQIINGFEVWKQESQVAILDFEPDDIAQVLDAYFSGEGVYKKPKSREDIPDAMINATILKLLPEKKELSVVVKDGAFKAHLQTIEGITTYDSLAEFLEHKDMKGKLEELDASSEKADQIKVYLDSEEFSNNLLYHLQNTNTEVEDIYLEGSDVLSKGKLGVVSFGESVGYVNAKNITDLSVENSAWLSDGNYSLEVSFTTNAGMLYCASYGDYMYLDEDTDRDVSLDSMNGDGVCDLSETMKFRFSGLITVGVGGDLNMEEIEKHSKYLGSSKKPVSIELDIQTAEILDT